ncbi:helix-turn-helix transcriptional regulator [Bifidobacterium sp. ESL0827]|uniref:helix-turn-helix transcriptional regulator n=1 Tax=Bifidobacterium sp. ESL0827 TaxID=3448583 RepID=UPI004042B53B
MELGSQIRRYRSERGMSQDDLAGRIFVSRQTISNWENDRTYPDVQNLLLLSNLFDVTIDQLIKGDLDTMKQALDRDVRSMKILNLILYGLVAVIFIVDGLVLYGVAVAKREWPWLLSLLVLFALLVLLGLIGGLEENIKRRNDIRTYREIKAFLAGEEVDRSDRDHMPSLKKRLALLLLVIVVCAVAGYALAALLW